MNDMKWFYQVEDNLGEWHVALAAEKPSTVSVKGEIRLKTVNGIRSQIRGLVEIPDSVRRFGTASIAQIMLSKNYSAHPSDPDNYWLSENGETVICSHCGREYPAAGDDAFDPVKDRCADDCPNCANQPLKG